MDSALMIIGRYIGSSLIKATLLVLLVFLGLETFILLATQVNSMGKGAYNIWQALLYVFLILPQQTYFLFPMAGLLGMLFGLSLLSNSSEIIVMRASGISPVKIMRYAMQAGLILVITVTLIGELIGPSAKHLGEKRKLIATSSGQAIKTGEGLWLRQGQNFYHIGQIDSSHRIENVSQYVFDDAQHLMIVSFSSMGVYQNNTWHMKNIQQSSMSSNQVTSQTLGSQNWDLAIDPRLLKISLSTPDEMSLSQLSAFIEYQKQTNLVPTMYQLSFWQRALQPLASLVMMFLAIPFVFGPLRSVSTSLRLVLGIIVGFAFYLTNQLFPPLSQVLDFPPYLAAMLPILIFAIFGVILLKRVR
ncbi:MAG: LPS export ABC transporter permease LptG [Gammaproteobacteria bacterium]|nr:LPS export ABC transporter permease LptG [Gammaproteobacteria bacterium]